MPEKIAIQPESWLAVFLFYESERDRQGQWGARRIASACPWMFLQPEAFCQAGKSQKRRRLDIVRRRLEWGVGFLSVPRDREQQCFFAAGKKTGESVRRLHRQTASMMSVCCGGLAARLENVAKRSEAGVRSPAAFFSSCFSSQSYVIIQAVTVVAKKMKFTLAFWKKKWYS